MLRCLQKDTETADNSSTFRGVVKIVKKHKRYGAHNLGTVRCDTKVSGYVIIFMFVFLYKQKGTSK